MHASQARWDSNLSYFPPLLALSATLPLCGACSPRHAFMVFDETGQDCRTHDTLRVQKVVDADVLIDRGEMNPDTATDEMVSLERAARKLIEARDERQRRNERASVGQVDDQSAAA
jgi:hypothetical protein